MSYHDTVDALAGDPEQLEDAYHSALKAGQADAFRQAIEAGHAAAPDNLLFAAWFHRLKHTAAQAKSAAVAWGWVIPLALANGLIFWWLSDDQRFGITLAGPFPGPKYSFIPAIFLLVAPIAAAFVLTYLTAAGPRTAPAGRRWLLSGIISLALIAASAYVLLVYPQAGTRPYQEQYLTLMALHLPLLAWTGVGFFLIANHRDPFNRFAFLVRSLEVFIMGGLFAIAGGLFTGISMGLFAALDMNFSTLVQRLFIAGGGGLIPVIAAAVIYNPAAPPAEQPFQEGLSKLIALLMRVLLPLTLLVLLVYLAFIPFNFRRPFENRDVLIIYNAMLFAVVALLVGATPINLADLSPRLARWLRLAIIAVAALALIISLYALAAILYRTVIDRLTPNRLAFIGWNLVNIGLLALLLYKQFRGRPSDWLPGLHRAYSAGTVAYAVWTVIIILITPWLFGFNRAEVEKLPAAVQDIIYQFPDPVLLKCAPSPHIYLLDGAEKRWIDAIETFEARGYVWADVRFISCADLQAIPTGQSIPPSAGPPPQP
jgi:hypothetical protein